MTGSVRPRLLTLASGGATLPPIRLLADGADPRVDGAERDLRHGRGESLPLFEILGQESLGRWNSQNLIRFKGSNELRRPRVVLKEDRPLPEWRPS